MPQVSDPDPSGHGSDDPRTMLDRSEVHDFLRFLLFDVAWRPKELQIRRCIAVARYLDWLADAGAPKTVVRAGGKAVEEFRRKPPSAEERDEKACTKHIADLLWGRVRRIDRHRAASNQDALRFLEQHADTHFANPFISRTIDLVKDFDVPADVLVPHVKPTLISRSSAGVGDTARLQDDLSERLFAADHVLKRTGLRNTRVAIVKVLNEGDIQSGRRRGRDAAEQEWLPQEVHERIKGFEKQLKSRMRVVPGRSLIERLREVRASFANKWIDAYRWAQYVESMSQTNKR